MYLICICKYIISAKNNLAICYLQRAWLSSLDAVIVKNKQILNQQACQYGNVIGGIRLWRHSMREHMYISRFYFPPPPAAKSQNPSLSAPLVAWDLLTLSFHKYLSFSLELIIMKMVIFPTRSSVGQLLLYKFPQKTFRIWENYFSAPERAHCRPCIRLNGQSSLLFLIFF